MLSSDEADRLESIVFAWVEARENGGCASRHLEQELIKSLKDCVIRPVVNTRQYGYLIDGYIGGVTKDYKTSTSTHTDDSVAGVFIQHMIEFEWIRKWQDSTERGGSTRLDEYLRQCLRRDLAAPGKNEYIQRSRTASSRIREYLSTEAFRTIAETNLPYSPWKAPAHWPDPVSLYSDDLPTLSQKVTRYTAPWESVRDIDCQSLIDEVFRHTRQSHYRPQFLQVMKCQGALGSKELYLDPRLPVPADPVADPVEDQQTLQTVSREIWKKLSKEDGVLLYAVLQTFLFHRTEDHPTFSDVYIRVAPIFAVGPDAIRARLERRIWPKVQEIALSHGIDKDSVDSSFLQILFENHANEGGHQ